MATILVVDDQKQICVMVAIILEKEGFSVLTATNGFEALQIARACAGGLDLLLSDIEMPGMDGAESPGLPVILMSGTSHLAAVFVSEPARFLSKPFSMTELATMARTMVHG